MINNFKVTIKDINALKRYVEDVDADSSIKVDILSWMFDNLSKIKMLALGYPKMYKWEKFHKEAYAWLKLTGIKE